MAVEKYGRCPCNDSWISQGYKSGSHKAIDLGWLNGYGANRPVYAWKSGTVVATGTDSAGGVYVVLRHDAGDKVWISRYWHFVKNSVVVKKGQAVKQGDKLGTRGNTGVSTGVHLHFEIWECPAGYTYKSGDYNKYAKDPAKYTYLFDGQVMKGTPALPKKPTEEEVIKPKIVEKDIYKHQVEVIATSLRVRTSPSTKGTYYCTCPVGLFNVIQQKEADGYIWFEIEKDRWIATAEGDWTKDIPATERKVTPVEENTKAHQVEVIADQLRVRTQPSTKAEVHCMAKVGLYNVLQEVNADGYLWFEIEPNRWIATKEGDWTKDRPRVLTVEEKLQLQIDNLTKEIEKAKEEVQNLQNQLIAANNEKAELRVKLENDLKISNDEIERLKNELDIAITDVEVANAQREQAIVEMNISKEKEEKFAKKLENIRIAGEWKV